MVRLQQLLDRIGLGARSRCRIFISYRRRGEGAGYAGRLADRLVREFGDEQCFRDVDDIESGVDFVDAISRAVGSCEVLVVVVAPDWLAATDANGRRRLDSPQDFVRIEIAAALARDTRVVPVLVGGARMPSGEALPAAIEGFARRQAHELSDTRWDYDVDQLVTLIDRLGVKRMSKSRPASAKRRWTVAGAVGGAAIAGVAILAQTGVFDGMLAADPANAAQLELIEQTLDALQTAQTARGGLNGASGDVKGEGSAAAAARGVSYEGGGLVRPSSYDPLSSERPRIMDAIRRANEAEVAALHRIDPTALDGAFTGAALAQERTAVQSLAEAGIHAVNTLHGHDIVSMMLSDDGASAAVELVETWSGEYHRSVDDVCVGRTPRHDVPQTVELVLRGGAWIVAAIAFATEGPDLEPCY